jgi:hypothetical protein
MTLERSAGSAAPSIADMKAAIGETRQRIAVQMARTADQVHLIFTTPASAAESPRGGAAGSAIHVIAAAGRARRAWTNARQTGLLRRAAIGGVIAAVAAVLAFKARRR